MNLYMFLSITSAHVWDLPSDEWYPLQRCSWHWWWILADQASQLAAWDGLMQNNCHSVTYPLITLDCIMFQNYLELFIQYAQMIFSLYTTTCDKTVKGCILQCIVTTRVWEENARQHSVQHFLQGKCWGIDCLQSTHECTSKTQHANI